MKFKQWLEYTQRELEQMPSDKLDVLAFGLKDESIIYLPVDKIVVVYDDMQQTIWQMKQGIVSVYKDPQTAYKDTEIKYVRSQQEWAEAYYSTDPCEVNFKNGRFELEDGHHRYLAAKILKRPLRCKIFIKDNPVKAILDKQK